MIPAIVERPMTAAFFPSREIIDKVHMPVCVLRDLTIGSPAIVVDPRHGPVVPVFETDEGGIDLLRGGERLQKDLSALFGSKEGGVGSPDLREDAGRCGHAV